MNTTKNQTLSKYWVFTLSSRSVVSSKYLSKQNRLTNFVGAFGLVYELSCNYEHVHTQSWGSHNFLSKTLSNFSQFNYYLGISTLKEAMETFCLVFFPKVHKRESLV